ncbi:FAD-binding protein [Paucibacter sp. APW11]|uniref:FAD-binding protein n=1 Tax=Roseateles aquae TaxID=3077235 RepID=A0ABU3PET2_9BURK|nr:FAD-binding protein [Paucibacter sp. APW11]MDT9001110.1 FAD-binding protein [Paucibacter sp. APW11]
MDKRRFLSWAAAGAATLALPSCGGGGGSSGTVTPPVEPPAPADPLAAEWTALAAQLGTGKLLRPGDADFARLSPAANARFDAQSPRALLRAGSVADIAAGLATARRLALPLRLRGGGHSYIGNSSGGTLLIDVGALNAVRLEGDVAVVGAGATLADVYDALIGQGRCIAAGSCLSVGIAGLSQGGGFGVRDREHGLTCDALLAATMVNAEGQTLQIDAQRQPELFWGLRGGGGGNFGVVTEFRFRTHAVVPLTRFQADFKLDELPTVLAAWQAWPQTMPDGIWSQLAVSSAGLTLWGIASTGLAELQAQWQGLLSRINASAQSAQLRALSYREAMLDDCRNLSSAQCHLPAQNSAGVLGRVAMAASSDFFDRPIDAAGIEALAGALRQRGLQPGMAVLNLMGGAIARVAEDDTAFIHRKALFSAQYLAEYRPGTDAATLNEAAQWTHGLRQLLAPWSSGRAYQNYLDGLITNPGEAYYGRHLARLQALKRSVDPSSLFKQAQGL